MNTNEEKHVPLEHLGKKLLQQYRERSYAESTIQSQEYLLHMLQKSIEQASLPGYSPAFGAEYLERQKERVSDGEIKRLTYNLYRTLIRRLDDCYLGRDFTLRLTLEQEPLPEGFSSCLTRYLDHCTKNGNRRGTVRNKRDCCMRFFTNLMAAGCRDIQDIDAEKVCRAVLLEKNRNLWHLIRQFLIYLASTGTLEKDFSALVPKPQNGNSLPSSYNKEEVGMIESSIDRSTPLGKRNYAMMLLASRLGIRRSDIARLTMDAVDFGRKQIRFTQLKTGVPITLPLLPEIEEAITDYIENARAPVDTDAIFIRTKAPYQKIGPEQLRNVTAGCMEAAGIRPDGKRRGPHSLRASLATAMVNDGISFEVVREVLGHEDPGIIKSYARIDTENLRECALDMLPPTGFFREFLEGRGML